MADNNTRRTSAQKLHAAYRLTTIVDNFMKAYTYKVFKSGLDSAILRNEQSKNDKSVTFDFYPKQLSYNERKSIIYICTPRIFEIRDKLNFNQACNYRITSKNVLPRKTSMVVTEDKVVNKLYKLEYFINQAIQKRIFEGWFGVEKHSKNKTIILFAIKRLNCIISRLMTKKKIRYFDKLLSFVNKTNKILAFSKKIEETFLKSLSFPFQNIIARSTFYQLSTTGNRNRLSFSRLMSASPDFNRPSISDNYLKDQISFKKTLRNMENIMAYHLKIRYFKRLMECKVNTSFWNYSSLNQPSKIKLEEQQIDIIQKRNNSRILKISSKKSPLMFNLLTTLIKNRLGRHFYVLRYTKPTKKTIINMPIKVNLGRKIRTTAVNKTRIIFLICHRLVKNKLKEFFQAMLNSPKKPSTKRVVAYGRVRELKRSCTQNRIDQAKRMSIPNSEAYICKFKRYDE